MYYDATPGVQMPGAIGMATSEDGIVWTKRGEPVLSVESGEAWDSSGMSMPVVQRGQQWVMLYTSIQPAASAPSGWRWRGRRHVVALCGIRLPQDIPEVLFPFGALLLR
jgi:predicted GH43/DUF377 family glycosyl hydrolase